MRRLTVRRDAPQDPVCLQGDAQEITSYAFADWDEQQNNTPTIIQ